LSPGEDIILYLPNNEVDLHGNMSSDDHGIVGWEWTRAPTQPGTSPELYLSNKYFILTKLKPCPGRVRSHVP
jgi:hypothetical protein